MAAGVEGERPLSHGTGACAHAARDAVERDAALRLELEDPQVHARPAVGGRDQRAGLTGVRAGHVGARDARLDARIDHRRPGSEAGVRLIRLANPDGAATDLAVERIKG